MVAKSTLLSPADPAKEISVVLSLPLGARTAAEEFVQHVSNPTDPLYHHYITPEEFAYRFGPSMADYAALKAWANENGLKVSHESVARTILTVRGTVARFQTLFNTRLNNYRSPDGNEYYSVGIKPTVPSAIVSKVAAVIGLNDSVQYAPHAKIHKKFGENPSTAKSRTDTGTGTGPGGAYKAQDLRLAYSIPSFGGGVPQTIAVFEQGGFSLSDVQAYIKENNLPNTPVSPISVNGYPTNLLGNKGVQLEAALDVDMIIGINPGVKSVLVYEDGDPFSIALINTLDAVAEPPLASILSISYGADEVQQSLGTLEAENSILTRLATEGITVLASSGDQGAYGNTGSNQVPATLNVNDPSAQPFVTSVGGTKLSTGPQESFTGEVVWNDLAIDEGATGGGVSKQWTTLPAWQANANADYNGGSSTSRNLPDVAAVGDPLTGVAVYSEVNGGWLEVGGTSVAAPIWASYLGILNSGLEYLKGDHVGFFNPMLYELMFYPIQLVRTPTRLAERGYLYDVSSGTNGNPALSGGLPGFNAGLGYDNCSGTGSLGDCGGGFAFQILAPYWVGSLGSPDPVAGLTAKQVGTSLELSWSTAAVATGYVIGLFNGAQPPPGPFDRLNPNGAQCFVTKATTILVKGVAANTQYYLLVSGVNQSGASRPAYIPFTTN